MKIQVVVFWVVTPLISYHTTVRRRNTEDFDVGKYELTAEWTPPVALPEVGYEVLQVHGAVSGVVAPVVHLAAPGGLKGNTESRIMAGHLL
jgi:hypothetical protein